MLPSRNCRAWSGLWKYLNRLWRMASKPFYRAFVLDNLRMTWQRSGVATAAQKTIPAMSERLEQCAVVRWANLFRHLYPELRPLHAIPNGEHRQYGKAHTTIR